MNQKLKLVEAGYSMVHLQIDGDQDTVCNHLVDQDFRQIDHGGISCPLCAAYHRATQSSEYLESLLVYDGNDYDSIMDRLRLLKEQPQPVL